MRRQTIVLGSVNTDLVIRGPRLPRPGETVLGGDFLRAHGGKGANQAVAAARLSTAPIAFVAVVGDDDFGRTALAALEAEHLDCRGIRVGRGVPTGVALILVDESGENLIGVASGANALLTAGDVDALSDDVFARSSVFLASLESPLPAVRRGLQRARDAGMLTILNPAPATRDPALVELLPLVDVLTPNEGEAELLAAAVGAAIEDTDAAGDADDAASETDKPNRAHVAGHTDRAHAVHAVRDSAGELPDDAGLVARRSLGDARALCAAGCRAVVVTLGSQGCLVVDQQRVIQVPACPVERVVDTTAAGDCFNGALAVALAEGRPLDEAARWASRAAAISVTRAGAQPSLPTRGEVERLPGAIP